MAREEIERIVWNEFVKFTGVEGEEDLNLEIFSIKRENFVRHLRLLFPELRLRNSFGKKTVEDFIDALFAEQIYKEKFINEVLDVVKKISGHTEYGLGNRLFEELRVRESEPETNARQAEEVKFFMAANKVFSALSQKTQYYPPYTVLANAENIRELAEIYYRRGQF